MHVLHLTNTFLPVTQNWVYSQITFNTRCSSSVLCQYRENEAQFPHERVYPMYPKRTLFAQADMLLTRARAGQEHVRLRKQRSLRIHRVDPLMRKLRFIFPVLAQHRRGAAGVEGDLGVDPVLGDRKKGIGEMKNVHGLSGKIVNRFC